MQPDRVLEIMKGYFAGKQPPEVLAGFGEQSPRELLKESLDVVDFVVYLEEELEREINLQELGQAILNKNFGELSVVVAGLIDGSEE